MKPVIVVIPVYKKEINSLQLCSLRQCFKILKQHPVSLVCPKEMDIQLYKQEAEQAGVTLGIESFDQKYFDDIPGYNRLLLSLDFFKRFAHFGKLLVHQTDAYVFKDELNYWSNKKVDYIGAPWFMQRNDIYTNAMIGVGNGGFSLRNIGSSIKIIKRIERLKKFRKFWHASGLQPIIRFNSIMRNTKFLFHIKRLDKLNEILFYTDTHEDHYWTEVIAAVFSDFKVAGIEEASQFSFEVNPSFLYKQNNRQLPFGCHAWEKYEPLFWANHIT